MTGNFRHLAKWLAVRGNWPNDWKFQSFGQMTGLTNTCNTVSGHRWICDVLSTSQHHHTEESHTWTEDNNLGVT
jgi:hypothetical protein